LTPICNEREHANAFAKAVRFFSFAKNLGSVVSRVFHPATTTHSQLTPAEQAQTGVTPEYVRLSVGIEDVRDIIADLDQALEAYQR
jgi:O-acetylhomoserine (thiol)-lyase